MSKDILEKYLTVYKYKNIGLPQTETNAYMEGYLDSLLMHKIITIEEYNSYIKKHIEKVHSDI